MGDADDGAADWNLITSEDDGSDGVLSSCVNINKKSTKCILEIKNILKSFLM